MLAIKLKRIGKKGQASFRLVVQEKRTKLQGRSVENLGWVNPRTNEYKVDAERVAHWLSMGAQPTDTVWNLLVKSGVVRGTKRSVHSVSKHDKPAEVATILPAAPHEALAERE
jgi:small subunit ribosomal protein S16